MKFGGSSQCLQGMTVILKKIKEYWDCVKWNLNWAIYLLFFNLVKESKKLSPEAEELLKEAILKVQQEVQAQ
jgi:hypothetical protein